MKQASLTKDGRLMRTSSDASTSITDEYSLLSHRPLCFQLYIDHEVAFSTVSGTLRPIATHPKLIRQVLLALLLVPWGAMRHGETPFCFSPFCTTRPHFGKAVRDYPITQLHISHPLAILPIELVIAYPLSSVAPARTLSQSAYLAKRDRGIVEDTVAHTLVLCATHRCTSSIASILVNGYISLYTCDFPQGALYTSRLWPRLASITRPRAINSSTAALLAHTRHVHHR